ALRRDYGDVVPFRLGSQRVYLLSDPEHIRDVLVVNHRKFKKSRGLELAKRFLGEGLLTSEGETHRRQRRLVQPAFHRDRIASYADTMVAYAARARDRWQPAQNIDVSREMMRLTLAIVGRTLFDADVEDEALEIGKALTEVLHLFDRV